MNLPESRRWTWWTVVAARTAILGGALLLLLSSLVADAHPDAARGIALVATVVEVAGIGFVIGVVVKRGWNAPPKITKEEESG